MSVCQVIALYVFGHMLGDFYLQSNWLVKRKSEYVRYLLLHCLIYSAVMFLLGLVVTNVVKSLLIAGIYFVTHLLIDFSKAWWEKRSGRRSLPIFCTDQIIHLCICAIVSFVIWPDSLHVTESVKMLCGHGYTLIAWFFAVLFAILAVCRPCDIFIRLLFGEVEKKRLILYGVRRKRKLEN